MKNKNFENSIEGTRNNLKMISITNDRLHPVLNIGCGDIGYLVSSIEVCTETNHTC